MAFPNSQFLKFTLQFPVEHNWEYRPKYVPVCLNTGIFALFDILQLQKRLLIPAHYRLFTWWHIQTMTLLTFPCCCLKYPFKLNVDNFHSFLIVYSFSVAFLLCKNTSNLIIDKHSVFKAKFPDFRMICLKKTSRLFCITPTIFTQREIGRSVIT